MSPEERLSGALADLLVISEIMHALADVTAPDGTLPSTWMGFLGSCVGDVANGMDPVADKVTA
jgi:hypothetical protein